MARRIIIINKYLARTAKIGGTEPESHVRGQSEVELAKPELGLWAGNEPPNR